MDDLPKAWLPGGVPDGSGMHVHLGGRWRWRGRGVALGSEGRGLDSHLQLPSSEVHKTKDLCFALEGKALQI